MSHLERRIAYMHKRETQFQGCNCYFAGAALCLYLHNDLFLEFELSSKYSPPKCPDTRCRECLHPKVQEIRHHGHRPYHPRPPASDNHLLNKYPHHIRLRRHSVHKHCCLGLLLVRRCTPYALLRQYLPSTLGRGKGQRRHEIRAVGGQHAYYRIARTTLAGLPVFEHRLQLHGVQSPGPRNHCCFTGRACCWVWLGGCRIQ